MTDKAWKATERAVAAHLGGRRVPITGRQRGDAPDVAHPTYSIEVKHRRILPGWLLAAMAQARAASRGDQLPLVVLHEGGRRHLSDLVVIPMAYFTRWYGEIRTPQGDVPEEEDQDADVVARGGSQWQSEEATS